MNVEQALELIFEDESESEYTDIILHPPADGNCSDEESGDEEVANADHLTRRQLIADAELNADDEASDQETSATIDKPTSSKKKMKCCWIKKKAQDSFHHTCEEKLRDSAVHPENDPDFFKLLFTDELMNTIYEETLKYSGVPFAKEELICVLGILIASGVVAYPRRRLYWSRNDLLRNNEISNSISVNRFEQIFSKLHFFSGEPNPTDKYFKIKMVFDHVNRAFMSNAPKSNYFAVDECIIPYYGRHNCKQFIRGKPIRFGFKCWAVASPIGYIYQILPYPQETEKPLSGPDLGSSGNVVYNLMSRVREEFPDEDIHVATDNYFTSVPLFSSLKEDLDIRATGTLRRNRIPNSPIIPASMEKSAKGSIEYW